MHSKDEGAEGMMTVRQIVESDMPMLQSWFTRHGWEQAPLWENMPKGFGYLCEADGVPAACGFLYLTVNSPLCFWEWTATNPDVGMVKRLRALEFLWKYIERCIRDNRRTMNVFTFLGPDNLIKFYQQRLGWVPTERATLMIRSIRGE